MSILPCEIFTLFTLNSIIFFLGIIIHDFHGLLSSKNFSWIEGIVIFSIGVEFENAIFDGVLVVFKILFGHQILR